MIVLLTWIYLSSIILILGAEVSSEYSRVRLRRKGHLVPGLYEVSRGSGPNGRNGGTEVNGHQHSETAEAQEPVSSRVSDS